MALNKMRGCMFTVQLKGKGRGSMGAAMVVRFFSIIDTAFAVRRKKR